MNKTSAAIVRTLLLGTSCLSVFGLHAATAQPTGGNVVLGSASIADHGANSTTINQTTGKAVINWNSFSIAASGTVQFNQPGAASITLNRVIGPESSAIYGKLLANGQVWLINGNGVLFGQGSRINVGGLIATTADIRDGDFESGNYAFSGGTGAAVVNQGTIKAAKGGSVVLSGASVSNQGLIQADTGTVVLGGASAFTVDFVGDGLLKYAIAAPAGQADNGQTGVSNSGTISAQGGHVIMTARAAANVADAVVNNTGMISATSAKVANGEVVLDGGDGDVAVSGTIDASGTGSGQTGGSVAVTGRNVTVADNTNINVSGDAGGGSVAIGGDAHGAGPLANAANTHVGSATITADAIHSGNGGKLVVWSSGLTDFSGIFSAKGGAAGGDGGFVETSGHTLNIGPQAKIDTTAPKGKTGTWLLDPDFIIISSGAGNNTQLTGGMLAVGTDPGQTDQVTPATIIAALATTNVTLQAANTIEVQDSVIYSSVNDLNLMAENRILVGASIQNTLASGGGAVNLVAGWDGSTAMADILATPGSYGNVNLANQFTGDVQIGSEIGSVAVGSASGTTTVAAASLGIFDSAAGYAQLGFHGDGGGDIVVRTTGDLELDSFSQFAMIGNGSLGGDVGGPVSGDIDIRLGGTISLFQGEGAIGNPTWIGNASSGGETGNVILVAGNNNGGGNVDFAFNLISDLQGGDFFLGSTDSQNPAVFSSLGYNSLHTLSLASTGELVIEGNIQNSGTGAINVIGGWDGTTVDPARLTDPGVYGNGSGLAGAVLIDACGCDVSASVGSAGGKVTVAGSLIDLEAEQGYAQIGYTGAGGGDIAVLSTGDIVLDGNIADFGAYAQIGNGAPLGSIGGPVTGNILLSAAGTVFLASQAGFGCDCAGPPPPPAPVLIGNASGDDAVPPPYGGRVAIFAADIDDSGMLDGGGFGDSLLHDIVGGDFTVGITDPNNGINIHDNFIYDSPYTLNLLSAGDITFGASVQNSGSGAITLVAGWNGNTDLGDVSAGGFYGNNDGTFFILGDNAMGPLAVGTASGSLSVYGANLVIDATNGPAQLGFHGAGGGNILVNLTGNITVLAGGGNYFAQIGNGSLLGDVSGNVTGDIAITVDGFTSFQDAAAATAWLGNVAGTGFKETGNVTALTQSGFFGAAFIQADLGTSADTGGNVFLGFTDPSDSPLFAGGISYNSPHDFTFAGAGSLNITGVITNAGTGAVTLVAGWDGLTVGSAAQIQAANAFGLNNGVIAVGNDFQFEDISVGSAGGLTTLLTHDLSIAPRTGHYAQVGYNGSGGGAVVIDALGTISLAGNSVTEFAQIGNGTVFGSNADSGNVTLTAQSITAGANAAVVAAALTATLTGGSVGASGAPLTIAANTLNVTSTGGNVFLTSPSKGLTLAGLSLNGGSFTLGAGGAITQSAAIQTGALNLSTTTGAITLLNGANSFSTLTVGTQGSDAASLASSGPVVVAGAQIGGTFTLTSGGAISQTGAITAGGGLVLSANGTIVLNNGGNSFATLTVATSGLNDASLTDSTAVTLGASTVGGRLTLGAGGAIAQSGILTTHGLNLSTTSGGIALTNSGNAVAGLVQFNAPGAVAFYNALATNVGASSVGGDLTLLSKGNVNFLGSVQSNTGNITAVAGWDGTTTNAAQFGNAGVFGNNGAALTVGGTGAPGNVAVGSHTGTTSVYASIFNVGGANGYAQLGYHGSGGGAILVRALGDMNLTGGAGYAMLGNGSLTADVIGNETGNIDVRVGGNANFTSGGGNAVAWLGNVAHSGSETGNVILVMNDENDNGQSDSLSQLIAADLQGGDFTVGFTGGQDQGPDHNIGYSSSHTLNILIAGNAIIAGSIQNAGTGAINLVGGWDGHTLSGFGAAGVSGNGGRGIVIGGSKASGGVAFGSAGGQTSVYGASLALNAVNGYAQLGFNGHGSGAILVNVTGGVTLTGGAAAGDFAQIGNGGLKTSGNNSGDIAITAGGDLVLTGGAGSEAYAQVGEGGAESNTGSSGYNNTAAITVTAANVLLNAGGGSAAYTMIGNGGYKSGINLTGAGVNGGNITVTSGHLVTLHGNGADAFAQIGNGGSQSNLNPSAAATGTDSGDLVVHAPNGAAGAVTLTAGSGADSYAMLGNGGFAVNSGASAVAANFTITGNVTVTDLSLTGGNGGGNSFSVIGNGDASHHSYGNVSGNIIIDANGNIIYINGAAPNSPGTIGNFTGVGTVSGTLQGATPPTGGGPINPAALGVIATNIANNKSNTNGITTISTIVITPPEDAPQGATDVGGGTGALGPIAMLDNGKDSTSPNPSDNATVVIADSLDGAKKAVSSQTILAGMLTQTSPTGAGQTMHGVPPADQDFSSWGNEALWQ